MSRLTGLLIAAGLLIGSALLAPSGASAREILSATVEAADTDQGAGCTIEVTVRWDTAELRGGNVTVTLYRSVDGTDPVLAGMHTRTDNDGNDLFPGGLVTPGESYTYEAVITKGPNHVVAEGETSGPVTCFEAGS